MSKKQEQIVAALKKLGPSSPTALGNELGVEPASLWYHLNTLLQAKAVKASGTSHSRMYALPDQKLDDAPGAPPPAPHEEGEQEVQEAQNAERRARDGGERFPRRDHRRQPHRPHHRRGIPATERRGLGKGRPALPRPF